MAVTTWAQATPPQLLSVHNPSVILPAGGNGNSVAPNLSADGRFVVFSSAANDLVPGGNSQYALNVFLRDRADNSTVLVSVNRTGTGGGNGNSVSGQVSAGGRYVVFQSDASDLVTNDTNAVSDIFVRDLVTGTTRLVSVATDGGPGNCASTEPVMSPDGRYVAFVSTANNLVAGDGNGMTDVFVRDLVLHTTAVVSVGAVLPAGATQANMAAPTISSDGRYVAFFSDAAGLASGAPSVPSGEIYLRDRTANTTIWASANAVTLVTALLGSTSNYASYHPRLSDDGRYVAFKAGSTNSGETALILRYDSETASTAVVNTRGIGVSGDEDDVYGPEMTPDGSLIVYAQAEGAATNPPYSSVHAWNAYTLIDTLVSDDGSGVPTNTCSRAAVISADGLVVAFLSNATNLVGNIVSNGYHIYLRDLYYATTQLVDADTNGIGSTDDELSALSLSEDGLSLAFSSPDGRLVEGDRNGATDVFVWDAYWPTLELVSARDSSVMPQSGDDFSSMSQVSVSADGRYVAFASVADDLVPNDTNRQPDVFVRDRQTGSNILVSVGVDGSPAKGGASFSPTITPEGRYVVFVSAATNLVVQPVTNLNIYRRDLQAGSTVLVSVSFDGLSGGNGDSTDPVISADGRYVAFLSGAGNLAGTAQPGSFSQRTFWRDIQVGVTAWLPGGTTPYNFSLFAPSISSDGRYVAYSWYNTPPTIRPPMRVRDTQLGTDIYTNVNGNNVTSAALSPDGSRLLYGIANTLYLDEVATGTTLCTLPRSGPIRNAACWSADSRFFVFVSSTNPVTGDDGTNKVCLYDVLTGTISVLGVTGRGTGSLDAWSDSPVVSGDGRFVAYRGAVIDAVPENTNRPPNLFLFDRITGGTAVLTAGQQGSSPVSWVSRPAISGSGNAVGFLDLGSGLVSADLNRVQDAFASTIDTASALVDSDGDGIPDWWMMKYFGHPTGQVSDLSRAQDDADGDGLSNLQEYLAGTDPTDPNSVLALELGATVTPTNNVSLSWRALPSKSYQVQYKDDLSAPVWLNAPGNAWVMGNQGYFLAPTATQPSRFYRVVSVN